MRQHRSEGLRHQWSCEATGEMLRHAIEPSARYTRASHDVIRHACRSSDAEILLLYVQGLRLLLGQFHERWKRRHRTPRLALFLTWSNGSHRSQSTDGLRSRVRRT